jgi:hypothetical protein
MPRKLKLHEVRKFTHRESGTPLKVMLDRNTEPADFCCDVLGEVVRGASESECKAEALKKCSEVLKYEWEKIAIVHTSVGVRLFNRSEVCEVSLAYEIHEIAKVEGNRWVERVDHFEDRIVKRYHGEHESRPDAGVYLLPWSEELEEGLKVVQRHIEHTRKQLAKLLGCRDAEKLLKVVAESQQLLLGHPATNGGKAR